MPTQLAQNALFLSQSGSLRMFHDLALRLQQDLNLSTIGMLVSHKRAARTFKTKFPDNRLNEFTVLSEWEIVNASKTIIVDHNLITNYERQLNLSGFRQAIMADRRINNGKKCTYYQDYKSRFSEYEQLQILQHSLVTIENLFNQLQPKFLVSFVCVTLLEYLCHAFAKSRGIQILNIRPTRIGNYMTFGNDITEPSNSVRDAYLSMPLPNTESKSYAQAIEIFNQSKTSNYAYEGTSIRPKTNGISKIYKRACKGLRIFKIVKWVITDLRISFGDLKDNHDPGILIPLYYETLFKPLLKFQIRVKFTRTYVPVRDLHKYKYIFFPLHTEPEKALLVDAPFLTNQIEVIRNIAQSLPSDTIVIVKDHPKSFGKRPPSYYDKILDIPNVRLVDPLLPTSPLVRNSILVITIAGSVGWEAVLNKKPVITLGNTPYEFLPDNMVIKLSDVTKLPIIIETMLNNYKFDKQAVIKYIIACLEQSISLQYYSVLLSRLNVFSASNTISDWDSEIQKLTKYTMNSLTK